MGVRLSLGRGATLEKEVLFALRERRDLLKTLTLGVVGYGAANALLALSAGAVAEGWGRTPFDHPVLPGSWSRWPSIEAAWGPWLFVARPWAERERAWRGSYLLGLAEDAAARSGVVGSGAMRRWRTVAGETLVEARRKMDSGLSPRTVGRDPEHLPL